MKSLLVLSLSLTVALGKPLLHAEQSPALTQGNLSPLLGDFVPAQGHVEVENPAPQPVLTPKEGQKPPAPEDQKLTENMVELEVKVKPEVQKTKELEAAEEEEEKLVGGQIVELKLQVKPAAEGAEKEAELNVMKEEEDKIQPEKEPVESEPDLKVESEVKVDEASLSEPEDVEAAAAEEDQHEAQAQSEDEDDTDFKVESETKVELETQEKEEEQSESAQEKFDVQMNLDEGREQMETTEWHIDMERPPEVLGHPFVESPEDDDTPEDEDDDSVLFGDQEQEDEELNNHLDASEMEPETVLEEEPDVHQMFQQNSETLPDKVEPLVVQEPRGVDLEEEEEPEKNPQTESGKFNDFTCWTPQAFVCSYPYH
ncbi:hypothetical protein FQA47_000133 [Oryzias melastigma]|uniref:Uncharacterized protein n=1 Tax=Oryzias melastigma TaxID=30732 RepID=A0A834BTQ3_ORYME|nr:hypothetical protein FQA47_000133 [Oryzias melastigma]